MESENVCPQNKNERVNLHTEIKINRQKVQQKKENSMMMSEMEMEEEEFLSVFEETKDEADSPLLTQNGL